MKRLQNFLDNSRWLSQITGSRISAILYLLKLKLFPSALAYGRCGTRNFYFRKADLSGLREILIDKEYEFISQVISSKKNFTILDCGAHVGLPVLWALMLNPSLRILSVEASPDTFKILEKNKRLARSDWKIMNRACWSDETDVSFSTHGDSMSHRASSNGNLKIKGVTLPDLFKTLDVSSIDLMKVDIEGAEENFLCSAPESLANVDRLIIELHPTLCDTAKVETMLKNYFPTVSTIQGRTSSKPLLYCRKAD